MFSPERHRQLLRLLAEHGRLSLSEAVSRLAVSAATIRRDFTYLAKTGRALRAHGALLPIDSGLAEPRYSRKAGRAVALKANLGRFTASLLPEHGHIFIDAGTTALEVGRALMDRPALRLYTNSLSFLELAPEARATVIALGGEVRPLGLALTGALTHHWLQNLRFDAAVIGASGLDLSDGASTTETSEAAVKTEALRRATRRLLVAHAEKWAHPAALLFAPWSTFTDFVTNQSLTRTERIILGASGLCIHSLP